ncbi:MAG TPA: CapA family protein [Pararhodobacter sp.]|uniref:CapA family protein n=1 Tax=Pararhodobacter sp. TaxID=2127056 RepID=UPI002BD263CC|nr:CapA family protein [Pararhodobacter sp.]HPD93402.1 CapA family protein [Pararhodobacter sp.]
MRALVFALSLLVSPAAAQVCAPADLPALNGCVGRARVSIAIAGDVLVHRALAWRGYARGFASLWGAAEPALRGADLAIANLEGPVAPGFQRDGRRVADPGPVFDDVVYTEYPRFNYHPVLIRALRAAGVDVVTTANNHAMDRGAAGADATLRALDAGGLAHVGTVAGGQAPWRALRLRTSVGPLALVACSFGTNGLADPRHQVPRCYDDRAGLLALVRAEAARGAGVLVLPHWGQEYALEPDRSQQALARDLAAAGAMAVVGTHPHVPQPWEDLRGPRGLVPVVYSTGNFVAAQPPLERATAQLAWLSLCAGAQGPVVAGAGYVPLQMEFAGADPSLTLPRPGSGDPRQEAGLALLARLIPGRALSLSCR